MAPESLACRTLELRAERLVERDIPRKARHTVALASLRLLAAADAGLSKGAASPEAVLSWDLSPTLPALVPIAWR